MVNFPDVNGPGFKRRVEQRDFVFDNKNPNWDHNDDNNVFFLTRFQNILNDRLRAQGYLFTNDVLNALGIRPTTGGQMSGWLLTNKREVKFKNPVDNFVEIKITQKMIRDGVVTEYFIQLNHDGLILFDALGD
jgi:hypothetical protein